MIKPFLVTILSVMFGIGLCLLLNVLPVALVVTGFVLLVAYAAFRLIKFWRNAR